MDLLFSRYASPYLFLDDVIELHRLTDFVYSVAKEKNDEKWWQLYLAIVANPNGEVGSFDDFKRKNTARKEDTNVNLEAVVKDSFTMLQNFNPDAGGEI